MTLCLAARLLILALSSAINLWYVPRLEVELVLGESILWWLSALLSSCFTSSLAVAILDEGATVESWLSGFGSRLASWKYFSSDMTESKRYRTAVLLLITGVQPLTPWWYISMCRRRTAYTSYEMTPSKFAKKSFTNGPKFRKFAKVFSLKSFWLCGIWSHNSGHFMWLESIY